MAERLTKRDADRAGVTLAAALGRTYEPSYLTADDLADLVREPRYRGALIDPRTEQPYKDEPGGLVLTHAGNTSYRYDLYYIGTNYNRGLYSVSVGSRGIRGAHQSYSPRALCEQVSTVINVLDLVKVSPLDPNDDAGYRDSLDESYRIFHRTNPVLTVAQFCEALAAVLNAHRENRNRSAGWLARMCALAATNEAELAQLTADRELDVRNMITRLTSLKDGARQSASTYRFDLGRLELLEIVTDAVAADMRQRGSDQAARVLPICTDIREMIAGARGASLPGCVTKGRYADLVERAGLVAR